MLAYLLCVYAWSVGLKTLFGQPSIHKSRTCGDCAASEAHINGDYVGKYIFVTQCCSLCDVVRHSCEMAPLRKEQGTELS